MSSRRAGAVRTWAFRALSVAIVVGGLVWLARSLDPAELKASFEQAQIRFLLGAGALNLVAVLLQAARFVWLARPLGEVRYRDAATTLIVGFAVSSVVPARAGEVARVGLLARRTGLPAAELAGAVVLDHVVNAFALLPLLVPLAWATLDTPWLHRAIAAFVVLALVAAVVVWFVAAPRAKRGPSDKRLVRWASQLQGGLRAVRSPRHVLAAFLTGIVAWSAEAGVIALALRAFDIALPVAMAGLVLVILNAALLLPAPPGNLGTLEVGAVLSATTLGAPESAAVAFAVAYHAVHLLSIWSVGAPLWWWTRREKTQTATKEAPSNAVRSDVRP